jgi:hypothetical protein
MARLAVFEQIENFQPRAGGLKANIFEVTGFVHHDIKAGGSTGYDKAF